MARPRTSPQPEVPGLAARRIAADILDGVLRRHIALDELLSGKSAHPGLAALADRDRALVRDAGLHDVDEAIDAAPDHRADDAPPYFTVVIVGHIVVGLVLFVEMTYRPPLWVHAALWAPLTIILALVLLPSIKGALIALQWALRMHGFDPNATEDGIEHFVMPHDQQVRPVRLPRS